MKAEEVLASLDPAFRPKVEALVAACAAKGVQIAPYFGRRTPEDQAKAWRQSRGAEEVSAALGHLRAAGASYLADTLEGVGPQPPGLWATNALPGQSWHQWGTAVDCVILRDGKAVWDGKDPSYLVYAQEAEILGLTAGIRWEKPDTDHVQLPAASSPLSAGRTWLMVNDELRRLYSA